ncbi:MAG: DNA gyrase inhibitor YacG [Gammaproteobacteria bacterium]
MNKPVSSVRTVHCPTCRKAVAWTEQQPWRPFCSERCKLIDLGTWFDESNRLPGEAASTDLESEN